MSLAVGDLGVMDAADLATMVLIERGDSRPPGRRAPIEEAARKSASLWLSVSPGRSSWR